VSVDFMDWVASSTERLMRTVRRNICAVLMALSAFASISSPRAEDLSAPNLSIKLDEARPSDTGEAPQSREDDASKVTDLEAMRAAVEQRVTPALSLGVSGWVGEQVIVAH
jgi:hypothetical protein